jgi:hypothetical protein
VFKRFRLTGVTDDMTVVSGEFQVIPFASCRHVGLEQVVVLSAKVHLLLFDLIPGCAIISHP